MLDSIEQGGALAYLLVFLAAATPVLEIVLVIPVGVAAGLSPVPVALLALAGNAATVAAVIIGGDRLLGLLRRRRKQPDGPSRRSERARHVMERWGVPGLAFLAPATTGTHVAAAAALALGASRRPVLFWMLVGLVVWAAGTTVVAVLGLDLLGAR